MISMEDPQAPAQVVAFPAPKPKSRLERDLERSIHAEAIASELAFAVYRAPWFALETWQQIRLRNTAVMAIRSMDPHAVAVARARAVEAFEDTFKNNQSSADLARVSAAIAAFQQHLTHDSDAERPTAAEDAAYARGIQRADESTADPEEPTGHGRY